MIHNEYLSKEEKDAYNIHDILKISKHLAPKCCEIMLMISLKCIILFFNFINLSTLSV